MQSTCVFLILSVNLQCFLIDNFFCVAHSFIFDMKCNINTVS